MGQKAREKVAKRHPACCASSMTRTGPALVASVARSDWRCCSDSDSATRSSRLATRMLRLKAGWWKG